MLLGPLTRELVIAHPEDAHIMGHSCLAIEKGEISLSLQSLSKIAGDAL